MVWARTREEQDLGGGWGAGEGGSGPGRGRGRGGRAAGLEWPVNSERDKPQERIKCLENEKKKKKKRFLKNKKKASIFFVFVSWSTAKLPFPGLGLREIDV